jgi:hypothetical protein
MKRRHWLLPLFCVASSAAFVLPTLDRARSEDKPAAQKSAPAVAEQSQFLRVVRDKSGTPTAMQTAVVRYTGKDGVTVDLIGAVHVGEKSYYAALNELFTEYEAMLYELVAPKGTKIPKGGGGRSGHPVGLLQHGMSDALGLVHQMNEVDYTKKNFVHADMTPDEFAESMAKRGESWLGMAFRAMGQSIAAQGNAAGGIGSEFEMLAAMFDSHPEVKLKRAFANQFQNMEDLVDAFGDEEGSTIITERNKKALEVLKKQLGKGKKHIAIFYGAAHLPDMHQRLLTEFGLKLATTTWLTAWDMSDPSDAKPVDKKVSDDAPASAKKKSAKRLKK